MQVFVLLVLAGAAVVAVWIMRQNRDQQVIGDRIQQQQGRVIKLRRDVKRSPFRDTGRGWWAWRVEWQDDAGSHVGWALTTREGIKEWRDDAR